MDYDLIVVGGGAAGLGAARHGARLGARVLLVSDGEPGGDCTFFGCVPSKTLIEAAKQGVSYPVAAQRVRDVVAQIAATEDSAALHRDGIEVRLGKAAVSRGRVTVDSRILTARRVVVATGSRPAVPPIPGLDSVPFLTNETVFDLTRLPATLAVLGGGAIGCELAQAFARLGSRVTVIEAADRLLPNEEPEASAIITAVFEREGIDVRTGVSATQVGPGVALTLGDGSVVSVDELLVAVGRRPLTAGLTGFDLDERGFVRTDERLATSVPGVYAAGDVTGKMPFTHAAFEMGRIAAGNALATKPWLGSWRRKRYRPEATPWVTFTDPEIARVGLTEEAAAGRGGRVGYLPMKEMDRALTAAETEGFVKLIAGPRPILGNAGGGRILGATIVASRAGEMIHEPALAMATRMFTGRLAAATHAYPTWSYGIQLTAAQFFMTIGGRTARPAQK